MADPSSEIPLISEIATVPKTSVIIYKGPILTVENLHTLSARIYGMVFLKCVL